MPMFNSDVLPDVTGRAVGSPDKQYDIFARNLTLSGSMVGGGFDMSNIQNSTLDKDTMHLQSDNGSGMLSRIRITNPASGAPVTTFKNQSVQFGGIAAADSNAASVYLYSSPTDTLAKPLVTILRQGTNNVIGWTLDAAGRIVFYGDGTGMYPFISSVTGEAQPRFSIRESGQLNWGPGGAGVPDTTLARTQQGQLAMSSVLGTTLFSADQLVSTIPDGTAPLIITSKTVVTNLNADLLDGASWASPPSLGNTTPATVRGTTITATGQLQSQINDGATPPLVVSSTVPVDILRIKYGSNIVLENGVSPDASGFKHRRVTTGSIAAGATALVVVTFLTPFIDANYTPFYAVFDSFNNGIATPGLRALRHTTQNAGSIGIMVVNDDATNAHTGTLRVLAIHD